MVSKFMDALRFVHYASVLQVLRYIKGTLYHGLHYFSRSSLKLHAYSDADCVGDPTDQCSIIGFCFLLDTSLVLWRSKKQDVISRSSIEAKYCAFVDTTCELIRLHSLLLLLFIVIIVVLSTLLITMSSMNIPSTLRSTATSLASISRKAISSCSSSPLLTNLLISSLKLTGLVAFEILYLNSSWLFPCYLVFEGGC